MRREVALPPEWFEFVEDVAEDDYVRALTIDRIHTALDVLDELELEVISLLWLAPPDRVPGPKPRPGLSVSEVARRLGTSRPQVIRVEQRALLKMKEVLRAPLV